MNGSVMKLLVILTVLVLSLSPAAFTYARGQEEETVTCQDDIVYNEEELATWCEEHKDSGGQVTLGGMVVITKILGMNSASAHITINTGSYGIVYNGGSIHIYSSGGFEIIGEGVDVPVLDVYQVGGWYMHWIEAVQGLSITATGRGSIGGTALRISQDDEYSAALEYIGDEGLIRSIGTGAIGVYLAGPLDVYCLNIETEGENSVAVYADGGAHLYYCKLRAEGIESSAVSGSGDILLDTCAAFPEPQNVRMIKRHMIDTVDQGLYCAVKQFDKEYFYLNYNFTFLLSSGDGFSPVTQQFYLEFDLDPHDVDTDILGKTIIQGSLIPAFQGLGLEEGFPLELVVEVRDPSIPCINYLGFYNNYSGIYAGLNFWDTYNPDNGNVILWRSDDGGESWYDYTASPDIEWDGYWLRYYYGELTSPVLLQLEVPGTGESNVVTIQSIDGYVTNGIGGDRTGVDRIVVNNGDDAPTANNDNGNNTENPGRKIEFTFNNGNRFNSANRGSGNHFGSLYRDNGIDFSNTVRINDSNSTIRINRNDSGSTNESSENSQAGNGRNSSFADHKNTVTTPLGETANADESDTENSAESKDELQAGSTGYSIEEGNIENTAKKPDGIRAASDSPPDMSIWIILSFLAAVSVTCALVWKRLRSMGRRQIPFLLAAGCAAAVFTCFLAYRYDNKYMVSDPIASYGVLQIEEKDLSEHPVMMLPDGWEYYGGRLLSPEDFSDGTLLPDEYIRIGQYGGFETVKPDASPHGSATYRLVIETPDRPYSYMLELPEIFSSYRAYINGSLLASMGDPDPKTYYPETLNQTVTFKAAGSIEIIIAVSDFSHFYSGMVYPPAFGLPNAVSRLLSARFLFRAVLCAAALVIGLLCVLVGALSRQNRTSVLYGLLCLFFVGYIGYPIVKTFYSGYYPFYALENVSFCAMFVVVMLLQRKICGLKNKWSLAYPLFGIFTCVASIALHLTLRSGNLIIIYAYSWLISTHEWITAAYLTAAAIYTVWKNAVYSRSILIGIAVFDTALVMDRLLPLHEPVVTGWFPELASFILVLSIGVAIGRDIAQKYTRNAVLEERTRNSDRLLQMQRRYYPLLQEKIGEAKIARHDLRHHFIAISGFLENGQYDQLKEYISDYRTILPDKEPVSYCQNEVADILAHYYAHLAAEYEIRLTFGLDIDNEIRMPDPDLCTLFSNLLENSVEACLRQAKGERFITLSASHRSDILAIRMENSCGNVAENTFGFLSSKGEGRTGYGLNSVKALACQYNGAVEFSHDEAREVFISRVTLEIG